MDIELTSLDDTVIFIAANHIASVEQQEDCSVISLENGRLIAVKEQAYEIHLAKRDALLP